MSGRELPEAPPSIDRLPVDRRGYPVPWFVAWLNDAGDEVEPGTGRPEFRVVGVDRRARAVSDRLCWVCGRPTTGRVAFVVGPMCAVNQTSSEPPSHIACATYAARACPFLTSPTTTRRTSGMPEGLVDAPGVMLKRNPGVALVWHVDGRAWKPFRAEGGVLFDMGPAVRADWWAEGKPATREQVEASIVSGLPALKDLCETHDDRIQLARMLAVTRNYLPAVRA